MKGIGTNFCQNNRKYEWVRLKVMPNIFFAFLFFKAKKELFWKLEKRLLFHFKKTFRSWDIQI